MKNYRSHKNLVKLSNEVSASEYDFEKRYSLRSKNQINYAEDEISESKKNNKIIKKIKSKKSDKTLSSKISQELSISSYSSVSTSNPVNSKLPDFLKKVQTYEYIDLKSTSTDYIKDKIKEFEKAIIKAKDLITQYENEYINQSLDLKEDYFICPENAIPISADTRNLDFMKLAKTQLKYAGKLFDVILMDPPWQLTTSNPSRGVSIAYETLSDKAITDLPVQVLQNEGFIFIWTINGKYKMTLDLLEFWGYKFCDEIIWVKQTINGKLAKGNGYYLQHCKESCLVGVKGNPKYIPNVKQDIIFSQRRGQSQKPEEIYEYIEDLVPFGYYLEIFGRRNNLRDYWVTIGNEI